MGWFVCGIAQAVLLATLLHSDISAQPRLQMESGLYLTASPRSNQYAHQQSGRQITSGTDHEFYSRQADAPSNRGSVSGAANRRQPSDAAEWFPLGTSGYPNYIPVGNRQAEGAGQDSAERAVRVMEASATQRANGDWLIKVITEVNSGGWQVFARKAVKGQTLVLEIRGVPPRDFATQAIEHPVVEEVIKAPTKLRHVLIKGADNKSIRLSLKSPASNSGKQVSGLCEREVKGRAVLRRYHAHLRREDFTVKGHRTRPHRAMGG